MTDLAIIAPQPQVQVRGRIRAGLVEYAREKVQGALRLAPRPVLFVRLTLERAAAHRAEQPYTVRVHVDVNGGHLHAHASGATFTEAVDLAQQRLRRLLGRDVRRR